MPDPSRTAARDLFTQAAEAGVAPLMLNGSPWAVRREVLPQIADAMRVPAIAGVSQRSAATPSGQPVAGVAVIPLTGVITPQGSWFSFLYGGAPGGLAAFREAFTEAVNSPDVSAIIIDVDSPGGLVDMVPETAAVVRAARAADKPIVAIADTAMCSAAYWIASQADEIVSTLSGCVGSIGVYRMHIDWSRANQEMGIAITYVHAGEHKVEGNPDEPLDAEAEAYWQGQIDDCYALFVNDVAAGRGISTQAVIDDYGQGRAMNAKRALEAGLVDRVATYETVVSGLLGRAPSGAAAAAGVDLKLLAAEIRAQDEASARPPAPPADEPGAGDTPAEMSDDERAFRAQLHTAR